MHSLNALATHETWCPGSEGSLMSGGRLAFHAVFTCNVHMYFVSNSESEGSDIPKEITNEDLEKEVCYVCL